MSDIMNTLHHVQTAEIIPLFGPRPKRRGEDKTTRASSLPTNPQCEEGATDTAGNQRLRSDRRDVWREAESIMEYWHMTMKMDGAISHVQRCGAPEGELHPIRDPKDYWTLVKKWREAWVRLMLTPAPDMRSVTWKRAELKRGWHKHTDLKAERIERAIVDDVEFLKAHPSRRGGGRSSKPEQEQ
jgi:hypothetical protein